MDAALALLTDIRTWESLATLTVLEVVLSIDNILFLTIVSGQLPESRQPAARRIGLSYALVMRIALLCGIAWVITLSRPVVTVFGEGLSWRDMVLAAGGLFLLTKGTREIHDMVGGHEEFARRASASFGMVILQIALFDLLFSFDSVVTAVGIAENLAVMIAAIVLSMLVMLAASGAVSAFVARNPTVKMLALSFLLLIGTALVADAAHFHIPRGYLYFAVAFSGAVEALNQAVARRRRRPPSAAPD
ncbi:MAG TPA: TerC family protein [Rhizomicrobium sp.]|nr:TerC family protein [Rhizomicrobium sp.]